MPVNFCIGDDIIKNRIALLEKKKKSLLTDFDRVLPVVQRSYWSVCGAISELETLVNESISLLDEDKK